MRRDDFAAKPFAGRWRNMHARAQRLIVVPVVVTTITMSSVGCGEEGAGAMPPLDAAPVWHPALKSELAWRDCSSERSWVVDRVHIRTLIRRLSELGWYPDIDTYSSLHDYYLQQDVAYLVQAAEMVDDRAAGAKWLTHATHRLQRRSGHGWEYLRDVTGEKAGEESIPILLLPSHRRAFDGLMDVGYSGECQLVRGVLAGLNCDASLEDVIDAHAPYSHTLLFDVGAQRVWLELTMSMPEGARRGTRSVKQPFAVSLADAGKAVIQDEGLKVVHETIDFGRNGAEIKAILTAVALCEGIYLTELRAPGMEQPQRSIAYPIADAVGGTRVGSNGRTVESIGRNPLENAIASPIHDPRLDGHSLLMVPLPRPPKSDHVEIAWTPSQDVNYPQERFVLTPEFAEADPPIVVVWRADSWEPFRPDFVITNSFESNEEYGIGADNEIEKVIIFTNIQPIDLLNTLGAMRGVDVREVEWPAEDLARLRELAPELREE